MNKQLFQITQKEARSICASHRSCYGCPLNLAGYSYTCAAYPILTGQPLPQSWQNIIIQIKGEKQL